MEQYARIRPLIGASPEDFSASLKALLDRLDGADLQGRLRVSLVAPGNTDTWDVDLRARQQARVEGGRRARGNAGAPDLEVIVAATTWSEIATGQLAPLEAFARGQLRFRGDADLANALYEGLKDDRGGLTTVCK